MTIIPCMCHLMSPTDILRCICFYFEIPIPTHVTSMLLEARRRIPTPSSFPSSFVLLGGILLYFVVAMKASSEIYD